VTGLGFGRREGYDPGYMATKPEKSKPATAARPAASRATAAKKAPAERKKIEITDEMIAERAYYIWLTSGSPDVENWLQAKAELESENR
jgi:hypothetical protein